MSIWTGRRSPFWPCCELSVFALPSVPWQLTTEIPTRRLVKPGLCPERAQMGAGICAEMCSFDVSCPDQQKCCSNGCGHVCMDPGQWWALLLSLSLSLSLSSAAAAAASLWIGIGFI